MQRMRSAGTPATPHRCRPPQHVPLRRVGLRAREWKYPAGSPSHAEAQWHRDPALLTYRCGGSAGLAFVGFTGFPFHSCDREVDKHPNAASVCRASSAASTASQSVAMPAFEMFTTCVSYCRASCAATTPA